MFELFCERVEFNYVTKTKEAVFQVNVSDEKLIEMFKLKDTREPIVNIYVGIIGDGNICYINADYHTCDGEFWYDLDYVATQSDLDIIKKEIEKRINQDT